MLHKLESVLERCLSRSVEGLQESSIAVTIGDSFVNGKRTLIVCDDNVQAERLASQFLTFSALTPEQVICIPELDILPYELEVPPVNWLGQRNQALYRFFNMPIDKPGVVITTLLAACQHLKAKDFWSTMPFDLSLGDHVIIDNIANQLEELQYQAADFEVTQRGEYIRTNSVLDIFPIDSEYPFRVQWDSNLKTIVSIRIVDVESQSSLNGVESFTIIPVREMLCTADETKIVRTNFRRLFNKALADPFYKTISNGVLPEGVEFYLPLFSPTTNIFKEFSESNQRVVFLEHCDESYSKRMQYAHMRYSELQQDMLDHKVLRPEQIWLPFEEISSTLNSAEVLHISSESSERSEFQTEKTHFRVAENLSVLTSMLQGPMDNATKVVMLVQTKSRLAQMRPLGAVLNCSFEFCKTWEEARQTENKFVVMFGDMDAGYFDVKSGLLLITEHEIFGHQIRLDDDVEAVESKDEDPLKGLTIGDLVVHYRLGIGRYNGLKRPSSNMFGPEYFSMEFSDGGSAFLPIAELPLVRKYQCLNPENVKLSTYDKNNRPWTSAVENTVKELGPIVKELLEKKAVRDSILGVKIPQPTDVYAKFCKRFPYQPTRDQLRATDEIKSDLCSSKVMNRIITGDVGFGKTEVAARAAMMCALHGYQVVVAVPSTLLCNQHYASFVERFKGFDVNICKLAGGNSSKALIDQIENGSFSIIISTHTALRTDIKYHNLGLVIVDEEHRFGVDDKAALSRKFESVNMLSMTATPIPRTLDSSLAGIRDTSVLSTPPASRLSIITTVAMPTEAAVRNALRRELIRNGQAFYLCNSIEMIESRIEWLKSLLPELTVDCVHGQRTREENAQVMERMKEGEVDVLVATTIIENGIDIANANTIIIENADRLGLATLHQLRGRVGRSIRRGYCVLLASGESISTEGEGRLKAMLNTSKLGDGLRLSYYDLQIRGAGELLGEGQSGNIQAIGYDLYYVVFQNYLRMASKMPDYTITDRQFKRLVEGEEPCKIELGSGTSISADYIPYDSLRIMYYSRLSSAKSHDEVMKIRTEIEDRFGPMPDEVADVFPVYSIRLAVRPLGITTIVSNESGVHVKLQDPEYLEKFAKLVRFESKSEYSYLWITLLDCPNTLEGVDSFFDQFQINLKEVA